MITIVFLVIFLSFLLYRFPSIKLNILFVNLPVSHADIQRLNELQTRLPNPYAICITSSTNPSSTIDWMNIQSRITGGKLRLLLSKNGPQEVVNVIISKLFDVYRNTEKVTQQEKFFSNMNQNMVSRTTACTILCTTFENLQIPEHEWDILMESLPSIAHIMTTTEETYLQSCPVSRETITKLTRFFSTDSRYV